MSGRDRGKGSARIDFDFVYARLITSCGFTPAEIDEMSLHDVRSLFAYWRIYPPIHEILKYVYKIEREPEPKAETNTGDPSGIGGLIARFPNGLVRASGTC